MSRLYRVAGVDPALKNLGLAKMLFDLDTLELVELTRLSLVSTERDNSKQVRRNSDDLRRCKILYDGFQTFVGDCSCIFAEVPTGSQSAAGMKMCGVATMLLATSPVPVIEVQPTDTKLASVGSKTASKRQIIEWASGAFPHKDWLTAKSKGVLRLVDANEHLADAVAVCHAGVQSDQFKQLVAMIRGSLAA